MMKESKKIETKIGEPDQRFNSLLRKFKEEKGENQATYSWGTPTKKQLADLPDGASVLYRGLFKGRWGWVHSEWDPDNFGLRTVTSGFIPLECVSVKSLRIIKRVKTSSRRMG